MHAEARDFIVRQVSQLSVLEIGSLNVNGGIRDLFQHFDYIGIDKVHGPGVDIVCDGADFASPKQFDIVVCCEVFEHAKNWRDIVRNVWFLLRPGGLFIGTAAGPGRQPHKCSGEPLNDDSEYYGNICPLDLTQTLCNSEFVNLYVEHRGLDVRWSCRKSVVLV